jgi:galactokinase
MGVLENSSFKTAVARLYGEGKGTWDWQHTRYTSLIDDFHDRFGSQKVMLFSTPGRTEIAGNHTDHNGGVVLAASVHLDTIAAVGKTDNETIQVYSEGYDQPFVVHLDNLAFKNSESGTTTALIRGIASRMLNLGYTIGGFDACVSSNVGVGSGLSSSASFEVLVATILNCLYNDGAISLLELAKIGRYAENHYFMKPCGLMDQIACGFGGIMSIDFAEIERPVVRSVNVNLSDHGYSLLVVRTGSDHADLTEDYADITRDMHAAAAQFDRELCRGISLSELMDRACAIRSTAGDRPLLRAYHFLTENERVRSQVEALERGDVKQFIELVQRSGTSSAQWLQNSYSTRHPLSQPISVTLALTEHFFRNREGGAYRVHGGGFAGTIQVFIPQQYTDDYIAFMESKVGQGAVTTLHIRPEGSICIDN